MSNINQHTVHLLDADGRETTIGEIPDLWHIAQALKDRGKVNAPMASSAEILEVWHMAHALKDAITEDRGAKIVEVS